MDILLRELNEKLQTSRDLLIFSLILARTMPMVVLTPFLGGKLIPIEIKMGLGVLLAIVLWPLAKGSMTMEVSTAPFGFLMLMLKEAFIGFAIGFVNSHVFSALDMAGRLIDTVRGTSMSEVMDPHSQQRVTPVGDLYSQLFLIVFVVAGGHRIFLEAFFMTFKTFPLDKALAFGDPSLEAFFEHSLRMIGKIWVISVVLAGPIVAATFITDVVFGILNRVAPQLNAYFLSMPVKAMAGVVMILVASSALMQKFDGLMVWSLRAVENVISLLLI